MNISELARKLRVSPDELRAKLPELGFDIGAKALKIPDREAGKIRYAWRQYKKRQYLDKKRSDQKARAERKQRVKEGTAEKVVIPATLTVREFAAALNLPIAKVMQELMRAGILASLNERIDFETATIIAEDLGYITQPQEEAEAATDEEGVDVLEEAMTEEDKKNLKDRPPVIVVMGHVDHGKTLLLDTIRSANVVASESGGITQHIGAYQVNHNERDMTFIDTPGHEAFTVMRSRGAKVADIAILVVAADDGVKPQTREAVDIIKAAKLPFVVAINKIDKPEANVDKIRNQLSELGLIPEDWGGKTIMQGVSAKTGENIDQLLDTLILVADMEKEQIVANPDRRAIGTIIESHVDKGQGPVATALVQAGTLNVGDVLGLRGMNYGKVRAMKAWDGTDVKTAPPATPVRILGFKAAPSIGDILEVPENPKKLDKLKEQATQKAGVQEVTVRKTKVESDDEDGPDQEGKAILNVIIRSDVLGSLEALLGMIEKIDSPYVGVKIVSKGLGNITESDIINAEATGAMLLAFNVKPSTAAHALARSKDVEIHEYKVIYKLFEHIVEKLKLMIPAERVYTELGSVKVLAVFQKIDQGLIVGGQVNKGEIELGATARVMRDDQVIAEGKIGTLQAGKMDVKSVPQGQECGIGFFGKAKIEVGDLLEVYKEEEQARVLEVPGV